MSLLRRFTLKWKLRSAAKSGLRFADLSAGIYAPLVSHPPPCFDARLDLCRYTAGWLTGSILAYMIRIGGRPRSGTEERSYDSIAFDNVERACRVKEYLAYMRGCSTEDVYAIRATEEFVSGYTKAWKEVVRFVDGEALYFPVGFERYVSFDAAEVGGEHQPQCVSATDELRSRGSSNASRNFGVEFSLRKAMFLEMAKMAATKAQFLRNIREAYGSDAVREAERVFDDWKRVGDNSPPNT